MNTRERFHAVLDGQPFDRLPVFEWAGWWHLTLERWRREGLPAELQTNEAVQRYLGLDTNVQEWLPIQSRGCPQPAYHGGPVIADERGYDALLSYLYQYPINSQRFEYMAAAQAGGDTVIWFTLPGFFWTPRMFLGIEPHLYAMYDQPRLVHRINQDLADYALRSISQIGAICTPDFMTFAEDLSYNHGPMLSEEMFNEFLLPYYRQVIPALKQRGIRVFVDSDGDITKALPWFTRAGIDGILPLERQAGVDVAKLRHAHPEMRFIGCFDKLVMHRGEAAIRCEFERLVPVAQRGGLIISVDHQTPPEVSLEDYRLYLRLFREYAVRAAEVTRFSQERSQKPEVRSQ